MSDEVKLAESNLSEESKLPDDKAPIPEETKKKEPIELGKLNFEYNNLDDDSDAEIERMYARRKKIMLSKRESWRKAVLLSQGFKVKDDPKLIRKSKKRKMKIKQKSSEKWKARNKAVEEKKDRKQQRRERNINKRIEEKKDKKIRRRIKK